MRGIALDQHRAHRVGEPRHLAEAGLAVERDHDVEPLRARRLDPARQAELVEEIAKPQRRRSQHAQVVFGGVEIEDADVGVVQVRRARRPHVRGDAVLVGQPQQRSRIADERMAHRPALLGHLDALQPTRESLRDVLVHEARLADARREALHRDRTRADVRQHDRRDRLVVRRELALRDPVLREHHLLGMRDHVSFTTSRAGLS